MECSGDCGQCEYCGDGICNNGETDQTCADCSMCGDMQCTFGENCDTCAPDCCSYCGDMTCDNGETCETCASDCSCYCGDGICSPTAGESAISCQDCAVCGDGQCTIGESCASCTTDCSCTNCTRETTCNNFGDCVSDICNCDAGFSGDRCTSCTEPQWTYPNCFVTSPHNNHSYLLVRLEYNFTSAALLSFTGGSEYNNSYLATITDEQEHQFIVSTFHGSFWVGGCDYNGQGTWKWVTGPEQNLIFYHTKYPTNMYKNFASNPSVGTGGGVMIQSGKWSILSMNTQAYFLLELGGGNTSTLNSSGIIFNPNNQHYYQYISLNYTWDEAFSYAIHDRYMNQPGYLVTITTPIEQNFIYQNFPQKDTGGKNIIYWAGATEIQGEYKWISKENTTFWNDGVCTDFCSFGPGEPNATLGADHHLSFVWSYNGELFQDWSDVPDNFNAMWPDVSFIIEYDCGCNGNGNCTVNGTCNCTSAWAGDYCDICVGNCQPCTRESTCSGHGDCVNGVCQCDPEFTGSNCTSCKERDWAYPTCYLTWSGNNHSYSLIRAEKAFADILLTVTNGTQTYDAYVATITSPGEQAFITSTFGGNKFWIGGCDYFGQGTWSWQSSPEISLIFYHWKHPTGMYANFGSVFPPNQTIAAVLVDESGRWNAKDFSFNAYYLMEIGGLTNPLSKADGKSILFNPSNQHYYQYVNLTMPWTAAFAYANSHTFMNKSGYLVTMTTPIEHNFIYQHFPQSGNVVYWGGASQTETLGTYKWISKENTTIYADGVCTDFCAWGIGQPSVLVGNNYLAFQWNYNNYYQDWKTLNYDYPFAVFIIEYDCGCLNGNCTSNGSCSCATGWGGQYCNNILVAGQTPSPTPGPTPKPTTPPGGRNCAINNGGCDYHVTCNSTSCGSCPEGTSGKGDNKCMVLCGDNVCDASIGENCVTCGTDCRVFPCGQCGDGECNATLGETCHSCVQDCGLCGATQCPGKPACSQHGTCQPSGSCLCDATWTGPACDSENVAIVAGFNASSLVSISAPGFGITFTLFLKFIKEVDSANNIVYQIPVSGINITLTETNTPNYLLGTLNATLENHATLNISVYIFKLSTPINFANQTTTFSNNTVKFGLQITNWPFRGLSNSLVLEFSTQTSADEKAEKCQSLDSSSDSNSNLNWVYLNINGVVMYGQFEHQAELDGVVRPVAFTLDSSDNSVSVKVPHFWDSLALDPNYRVLLDSKPSSCKKSNSHLAVEIAVPIVIFLVIFAVVFVIVILPRLRLWLAARSGLRKVKSREIDSKVTPGDVDMDNTV